MGKPKFRRLSYDLYEMLEGAHVPSSTLRIVLVVIDFTIGYRQESTWISLSTFQNKTGLSRKGVVRAIHDAEQRGMVRVERQGTNPKAGTIYAINTDLSEWLTSKPQYTSTGEPQVTSKLVNHKSPDWCTPGHQTSDIATSATPIQRNYNVTLKKGTPTTPHPEDTTTPTSSSKELVPPLPCRERKVVEYLREHGPSGRVWIARALDLKESTVSVYLSQLKKAGMVVNKTRGSWEAM